MSLTPETLTFEHIKSWSGEEMRKWMQHPEMREAIYRVAQERAQVQPVSDNPVAVDANEPTEPTPEVAPQPTPEPTPAKKIVVDYQVRDEDGNPLGRPTHLEAATEEEMRDKIIKAHSEAVKFAHRLKKQNLTLQKEAQQRPAAPAQTSTLSEEDTLQALKDLRSEDPKVQLAAHKKLNQAEEAKRQAERDRADAEAKELKRQQDVSVKFLTLHQNDFNNCQANIDEIGKYFEREQLPWTLENLEIAFDELSAQNKLAPVAKPAVDDTPTNSAPAPTSATSGAAVPVQQAATPTVQAMPPANPAPAQPRPGVNGGIVPGQNSATRPTNQPKGLTMADINSWDAATMRTHMRNPQKRAEIERVVAEARAKRGL
jgi:hypothetical protein